jgi:hypothetical protein
VVARAAEAVGGSAPEEASSSAEPPDPWEAGTRAALAKSPAEARGLDLLLLGADEVEVVLVDLDGGVAADGDPAALVRARAFEAEIALAFGARRLAYYDRNEGGGFELALEDGDGDGVAETRWSRVGRGWCRDAPVALPWLSQGYLALGKRSEVEVTACLQAFQRGR